MSLLFLRERKKLRTMQSADSRITVYEHGIDDGEENAVSNVEFEGQKNERTVDLESTARRFL
jgi:hypothetical protein